VSEGEKSGGMIKPIIVSVASTVLGTALLVYLGFVPTPGPRTPPGTEQPPPAEHRPQPAPEPRGMLNISGTWRTAEGLTYVLQQRGNVVTVEEIDRGVVTSRGQGTLVGRDLDITYSRFDGSKGRAHVKVSADGKEMTGTFTNFTFGESGSLVLYR
jgi:hypothetical protein